MMKTLATLALAAALLASAACAGATGSTAGGATADPITNGAVPGRSSATSAGGGVAGMGGISGAR